MWSISSVVVTWNGVRQFRIELQVIEGQRHPAPNCALSGETKNRVVTNAHSHEPIAFIYGSALPDRVTWAG